MFLLLKYEVFARQNELYNIKKKNQQRLYVTRFFFRKNPVRSLLLLLYFYFEFNYNDFYVSSLNYFSNTYVFNSYHNIIDEESDILIFNYFYKYGANMIRYINTL